MKLSDNLLYLIVVIYLIITLIIDNYVSVTIKKFVVIPIGSIIILLIIITRINKWMKK